MNKHELYRIGEYPVGYESPATPTTGLPNEGEDCHSSNFRVRQLVQEMGLTPLITEEKEGRMIHDIIPIENNADSYSNEGSGMFPMHVEVPHYDIETRPSFVLLYCVKGNPKAETHVLPVYKLLDKLSGSVLESMRKPIFEAKFGESFGNPQTYTTPLLHEDGRVTIDLAEMYGVDDEGRAVLEIVRKTIELYKNQMVQSVVLHRGQYIIFDNKRCLHSRSDFKNHVTYDGSQRWLKRVYLK
jgi:L-asparagine oxygenase